MIVTIGYCLLIGINIAGIVFMSYKVSDEAHKLAKDIMRL